MTFQRCWVEKKFKFYEMILMNSNEIFSKGTNYKQLRLLFSCKVEMDVQNILLRYQNGFP